MTSCSDLIFTLERVELKKILVPFCLPKKEPKSPPGSRPGQANKHPTHCALARARARSGRLPRGSRIATAKLPAELLRRKGLLHCLVQNP